MAVAPSVPGREFPQPERHGRGSRWSPRDKRECGPKRKPGRNRATLGCRLPEGVGKGIREPGGVPRPAPQLASAADVQESGRENAVRFGACGGCIGRASHVGEVPEGGLAASRGGGGNGPAGHTLGQRRGP